jgi:hypothetical protein
MKGKVIAAAEVKARWGYAEVTSARFGETYKRLLSNDLFEAVHSGVPFDNLSPGDHTALILALKSARNPGFVDNVEQFGAAQYECTEWQVGDLLNSMTIPAFGQVPYYVFLARPPGSDAAGTPDSADPRYQGHKIPFDPNFEITEPLIAINFGSLMLLEGYLRSILWLRSPAKPLDVWIPKS